MNNLELQNLTEIRDTLNEIIRMHELNSELLRTLLLMGYKIHDYAKANNILNLHNNFYSLLRKAEQLITDISSDLPKLLNLRIQRNFTEPKSDKDFTEPLLKNLFSLDP